MLVVGLGGLGCPASLALAQAGVRRFTFVDPDRVELSNLHRQLWHRGSDLGRWKVESAAARMASVFPEVEVRSLAVAADASNLASLMSTHDRVIDGTDGPATKRLLSRAAVRAGVPLVYGGVLRWQGQAMRIRPGGPCLECLFEETGGQTDAPTCAQAGVMGALAGLVGGLQATLALAPESRAPEEPLFVVEGASLTQRKVQVTRRPDCPSCGLARGLTEQETRACER